MKKLEYIKLLKNALDANTPAEKQKIKDDLLFDLLASEANETPTVPTAPLEAPLPVDPSPEAPEDIQQNPKYHGIRIKGNEPPAPKSRLASPVFIVVAGGIAVCIGVISYLFFAGLI